MSGGSVRRIGILSLSMDIARSKTMDRLVLLRDDVMKDALFSAKLEQRSSSKNLILLFFWESSKTSMLVLTIFRRAAIDDRSKMSLVFSFLSRYVGMLSGLIRRL